MKLLRPMLLVVVLISLTTVTFAQPVVPSDAHKAFDLMKTLAGTWQGPITTDDPAWGTDKPMSLSMRVASHGNALIHELNTGGPEVTPSSTRTITPRTGLSCSPGASHLPL
jgi:hypothetical protein